MCSPDDILHETNADDHLVTVTDRELSGGEMSYFTVFFLLLSFFFSFLVLSIFFNGDMSASHYHTALSCTAGLAGDGSLLYPAT